MKTARRIMSILLAVMMLLSMSVIAVSAYTVPHGFKVAGKDYPESVEFDGRAIGILGDADLDEKVTIKDATLIQKAVALLEELTQQQEYLADVNFSLDINVKDATLIQKYIALFDIEFPIGQILYDPYDKPVGAETEYFINTENWEDVYVYASSPADWWTGEIENAPYPGELAEFVEVNDDGFEVYSFTYATAAYTNIVFNPGFQETTSEVTTAPTETTAADTTAPTETTATDTTAPTETTAADTTAPTETTAADTTAPTETTVASADETTVVPGTTSAGTTVPVPEDITVYFTNSEKWEDVQIHYWNDNTGVGTDWPGKAMEYVETNGYGQDIYCYTIPGDTTGIVFNTVNGSTQTVDVVEGIADCAGFYPTTQNSQGHWELGTYTYIEVVETTASETTTPAVTTVTATDAPETTVAETTADETDPVETTTTAIETTAATVPDTTATDAPETTIAPELDYYLVGYINGADYGIEGDWENLGEYKFVDGKVTAVLTADSYVAVKDQNNLFYMTDGWLGTTVTSAVLTTEAGANSDKLYVPKGEVTFTFDVATKTISYEVKVPETTAPVTTVAPTTIAPETTVAPTTVPGTTAPTETEPPTDPDKTYYTIGEAQALTAGTKNVTVRGTVTYVNGRTVYIEDATGAMMVYFKNTSGVATTPAALAAGDYVEATGTTQSYMGITRFNSVNGADTNVFSILYSGKDLPSQTVTVADLLGDTDLEYNCERIYVEKATLSDLTATSFTITQNGKSIAVTSATDFTALYENGDIVNLYIVAHYNSNNGYQPVIGKASEMSEVPAEEVPVTITFYAVKTGWVSEADAIITLVDNDTNEEYTMTKDADGNIWTVDVPSSVVDITFNRYDPATGVIWNYWVTGDRGEAVTFQTADHESGEWNDEIAAITDVTVYFDNSATKWDYVALYQWSDTVGFPQYSVMTQIEGTDIWKITVPSNITNGLFKGTAAGAWDDPMQTVDIKIDSEKYGNDILFTPSSTGGKWNVSSSAYTG